MITPYWILKVLSGLGLVAYAFIGASARVPFPAPQVVIAAGAILSLSHHARLRYSNKNLQQPETLVTDLGLYRKVRHPMYFGDVVLYVGLAGLSADWIALALLLAGIVGVVGQSLLEDRFLAERFPDEFPDWKKRTRLLIPFIV